ncbi:hypothetical protein ABPG74_005064 [Tetrahymena malaccensis]
MEKEEKPQTENYREYEAQRKRRWLKILYNRYSSGEVNDDKQHNASTDNSQIKTSNEEVQNDNLSNKPEDKYLSLLSESQIQDTIQQFRQHNWREFHSLFKNLEKYESINFQNVEYKIANEIMIQLKNITNVLASAYFETDKDDDLEHFFLFVVMSDRVFQYVDSYRDLLKVFFDEICKNGDEMFIKNCLIANYLILFADWQKLSNQNYFSLQYFSYQMTSEETNEKKIFKIGNELKQKNKFLYKE